VTDEVTLEQPQDLGTALVMVTLGEWRKDAPGSLLITDGDQVIHVDISSTGGDFEVQADEIHEDNAAKAVPIRLGINLKRPVTHALVTIKITPVSLSG